jgi:hypothetical protein
MAKLFEQQKDLDREEKTIKEFVNQFGGSYEKLPMFDIDFLVYDKNKNPIAYCEIKGRNKNISHAYPLPISLQKVAKLLDKKLTPVIIWSCFDGIIYGKLKELEGVVKWGGRLVKREGSVNDTELMIYYNIDNPFKEIQIENFSNQ